LRGQLAGVEPLRSRKPRVFTEVVELVRYHFLIGPARPQAPGPHDERTPIEC
jgi:hypothetical protein